MSVRKKLRDILLPYLSSKVDKSLEDLDSNGFLYKKKFFSKIEIKEFFPNLKFCESNIEKKIYLKKLFEKYSKFYKNKKIDVRAKTENHKIDYGLIDIRDPDELQDEHPLRLRIDKILKRIEEYIPNNYIFNHFNVYLYSECFKPRCLHIDSFNGKHLKAFIYLTNSNFEDGVYSYVPGSHKKKFINFLQYILNTIRGSDLGVKSNDGTLYSVESCFSFPAEVGDMLISDQRGVHGDLPCNSNGSGKIVLVVNFLMPNL